MNVCYWRFSRFQLINLGGKNNEILVLFHFISRNFLHWTFKDGSKSYLFQNVRIYKRIRKANAKTVSFCLINLIIMKCICAEDDYDMKDKEQEKTEKALKNTYQNGSKKTDDKADQYMG